MADLDPADPVRDALSDLASRPGRPAGAVLEDLRPAMGRARLHRRVHVASMSAAAAVLVVVGGLSLRTPTEAQQVQIAGETSGTEEILPAPERADVTSTTTVVPSTTVSPTTVASTEPTVASPTTTAASAPAGASETATPPPPGPAPEPTSVPAVTAPPAVPTTIPTTTPPSGSSQTLSIPVPGAGTITVTYTPTTITDVEVTTTGGYTYEIEDRTVHEVKVEFEGGGPKIEVEVHLEDGVITYQIDGDESES